MDNIKSVLRRAESRWIFSGALILLVVAVLFMSITLTNLSGTAAQSRRFNASNHSILQIVKAATGCEETNSVAQCKEKLAQQQTVVGKMFIDTINSTTVAANECRHSIPTASDADFESCVKQKVSTH